MSNFSIEVRTEADGSIVVRPDGALDSECAVEFRQVLVHAVRRLRPLRLILDLSGVTAVDPINLGTVAALCDLADDHQVVVFIEGPTAGTAAELRAAGVPSLRFRQPRDTAMADTPAVASMS